MNRLSRHYLHCALLLSTVIAIDTKTAQAADRIPGFEIEQFSFNPGAEHSMVVDTGALLRPGAYRLSLAGHYEKDPLVLLRSDGTRIDSVLSNRWSTSLVAAFAPARRWQLGLQVPIVLSQGGDNVLVTGYVQPAGQALGTPLVEARFGVLMEDDTDPFDLSLGLRVGLPVGSADALTRDDGLSAMPKVGLGKKLGDKVHIGADAGLWLRNKTQLSDNPDDLVGSQVALGVGLSTIGDGVRFEAAARTAVALRSNANSLELLGGVRVPASDRFELFALGGPGLGHTPGTPSVRIIAGVALVTPPPPARVNPCAPDVKHLPADCPDLDDDLDGIKNRVDACPLDPEDQDDFEDADGCPDPDNDKDGILDPKDRCPNQPGVARFEGCPPPDQDKDGVFDPDDECPTVPGPVERKGCPVVDRDGDGVLDKVDACIDEPGVPENQGCPAAKKQLVAITEGKLKLLEKVFFDTAKAIIKLRSYPLLDQVAKVLKEHPDVAHVDIEGHTDSRGKRASNLVLSQARADAVMVYVVGAGIDKARLSAKGYGPDRPSDTNKTTIGREANRRVEFIIKEKE